MASSPAGTHGHIFVQCQDFCCFFSFVVPPLIKRGELDFFLSRNESESYVTTDGQSASLSLYKAPIRGLRPDFYFRTENGICLTVTFLIPWGALSGERTALSFVCAAGPCQRSLSLVLVPWDLRLYFTVSDLRLPFSSPPTTRRVTVEVFDPASTRVSLVISVAPRNIASARTSQKTPLPTVLLLQHVAIDRIAQRTPFLLLLPAIT
jgi:hypothetical protein